LEQEQVMTAITQQLSGTAVARAERSAVPTGGFTLIEIMITVAIVAILAAIAFPGYQQYVLRSKRGLAKSTLVQVLDRQSQFYVDNKSFATDLTALGYAANGFGIDDKGREVAADASNRIYTVTLVDPTATAFSVNAAPFGVQAKDKCATLTIDHRGKKSAAKTDCW
jgi:type IV pilus assembly protein PilE